MGQHTQHNLIGVVDKGRAVSGSAAVAGSGNITTTANYADHAALDARLTAISATTYTQAQLDKMTLNDKRYAVRLADDADSI